MNIEIRNIDTNTIEVNNGPLPEQFKHLQEYVPHWAAPRRRDRLELRLESSMDQISDFYDAMTENLEALLGFLDQYELSDMPPDVERLFLLSLSLAEIHPCVENYGQQTVIDGYDMRKMHTIEET